MNINNTKKYYMMSRGKNVCPREKRGGKSRLHGKEINDCNKKISLFRKICG